MSRTAPNPLYLAVSLGALAALAATFITVSHPVSENVTDAIPAAAVPPAPSLASSSASGMAGRTFTVVSAPTAAYGIRLGKVTQQATLSPYESLENAGDHIAAAEFTVTGKGGQAGDDPDLAAVASGSNGAAYIPAEDDITGDTSFKGQFTVGPGQTQTGWVTFELPPDVAITRVQWRPAFGAGAITWTIPAEEGPSPDGVDRGH